MVGSGSGWPGSVAEAPCPPGTHTEHPAQSAPTPQCWLSLKAAVLGISPSIRQEAESVSLRDAQGCGVSMDAFPCGFQGVSCVFRSKWQRSHCLRWWGAHRESCPQPQGTGGKQRLHVDFSCSTTRENSPAPESSGLTPGSPLLFSSRVCPWAAWLCSFGVDSGSVVPCEPQVLSGQVMQETRDLQGSLSHLHCSIVHLALSIDSRLRGCWLPEVTAGHAGHGPTALLATCYSHLFLLLPVSRGRVSSKGLWPLLPGLGGPLPCMELAQVAASCPAG